MPQSAESIMTTLQLIKDANQRKAYQAEVNAAEGLNQLIAEQVSRISALATEDHWSQPGDSIANSFLNFTGSSSRSMLHVLTVYGKSNDTCDKFDIAGLLLSRSGRMYLDRVFIYDATIRIYSQQPGLDLSPWHSALGMDWLPIESPTDPYALGAILKALESCQQIGDGFDADCVVDVYYPYG